MQRKPFKIIIISDASFMLWIGKCFNSDFSQYQFDTINDKLASFLENHSKMATIISIANKAIHRSSKSNLFLMPISRRDLVNSLTLPFPISFLQKQWKIYLLFGKSLKNGYNNLYLHPKSFQDRFPLWF